MKQIHSGKLRAIGYDAARHLLRVELDALFGGAPENSDGQKAD
jgi:hypothetical protein